MRELAADGDIEADGETGEVASAAAAAQQNDLVELEPERFQQFLRLRQNQAALFDVTEPVSYTHLTLPTSDLVEISVGAV